MEYLGAWGTLIPEENLKSKISCQTPFKPKKGLFLDRLIDTKILGYLSWMQNCSKNANLKYFQHF